MRWALVASLTLMLSGCLGGHLYRSEPNPENPVPGFGYVDFYCDGPEPWQFLYKWQVFQTLETSNLWGETVSSDHQMDGHIFLVEIVTPPHRLVRVESIPGVQTFKLRALGQGDYTTTSIDVIDGVIVPVRVNIVGSERNLRVTVQPEQSVRYRHKEEMPYASRR